jgi:hypothetical protein
MGSHGDSEARPAARVGWRLSGRRLPLSLDYHAKQEAAPLNRFTLAIAGALLALVAFGATTASAQNITAKQASLDEVQEACTDAGGTITGWHFIINQVREGTPPANILVTFSGNNVPQVVPLAKTSGPVGHYNVTGTATNTLITGATAMIYDGWSGQFNLSSVDCRPPLDACAEFPGRTVIPIDELLFSGNQSSDPIAVTIAPGTYAVTLGSFDPRLVPQVQTVERWFAVFGTAAGDVTTNAISDVPDDQMTLDEEVGEITLTATATTLTAVHFLAGMTFSTPESVTATCVALDPVLD